MLKKIRVKLLIEVDNADMVATRAILDKMRIRIYDECFGENSHEFYISMFSFLVDKLTLELIHFIVIDCKGYLKMEVL